MSVSNIAYWLDVNSWGGGKFIMSKQIVTSEMRAQCHARFVQNLIISRAFLRDITGDKLRW